MNSTEIFALALGLNEPWKIADVDISVGKNSVKEFNIHLGFKRGAKFEDEAGVLCSVHDTQKRTWRHLNFFEHTCKLHYSVPRIAQLLGENGVLFNHCSVGLK